MKPVKECIVLAGGRGTRLSSVISDVPKPLAPVSGRPFLAWVLYRLSEQGIQHVILATGYLSDQLMLTIGGRWNDMSVSYSNESEPLGTGGAIKLACQKLVGSDCHVLNGDTYVEYSLAALENAVTKSGAALGMVLVPVDNVERYGCVLVKGGRAVGFSEKGLQGPGLINAGCYLLTERAINALPETSSFSFEQNVLMQAVARADVAVIDEACGFVDIGVPEDYARAQKLF